MDSVIKAATIYLFLMLVLRISGHRTLNEMTTFDFVLLLIIGDASQQAMTGTDYSLTNGLIIISTLVVLDILLSILKQYFPIVEKVIDGMPLLLIIEGKLRKNIMKKVKIDVADVLEAARKAHGLKNLKQIKYAILEKDGEITIIPFKTENKA